MTFKQVARGTMFTAALIPTIIGATSLDSAAKTEHRDVGIHQVAPQDGASAVYVWGKTDIKGTDNYLKPKELPGSGNIVQVFGQGTFSFNMAINSDGTVSAWGNNADGQLGIGNTKPQSGIVTVSGLSDIIQLEGGNRWALALSASGAVYAWGLNEGDLGTGAKGNQDLPMQITFPSNAGKIVSIAAAAGHGFALDSNDNLWVWGVNHFGELGLGPSVSSAPTPVEITSLSGQVAAISTGFCESTALLTNGTLDSWGLGEFGALGNGTTSGSSSPTPVIGLSGLTITQVSSGGSIYNNEHTAVLTSTGKVYQWGTDMGDGGKGKKLKFSDVPMLITKLPVITSVSAGGNQTLALDGSGDVYAWGGNSFGQVGTGTTRNQSSPVKVLSGATQISGNPLDSVAIVDPAALVRQ